MVEFFQSLQGTEWQERLLFLQQNTETYRWATFGVCMGVHLIFGLFVLYLCRKKLSMDVGAMAFIPVVSLLMLFFGIVKFSFSSLFGGRSPKKKEALFNVGSAEEGIGLGESDNGSTAQAQADEEDSIDLF